MCSHSLTPPTSKSYCNCQGSDDDEAVDATADDVEMVTADAEAEDKSGLGHN